MILRCTLRTVHWKDLWRNPTLFSNSLAVKALLWTCIWWCFFYSHTGVSAVLASLLLPLWHREVKIIHSLFKPVYMLRLINCGWLVGGQGEGHCCRAALHIRLDRSGRMSALRFLQTHVQLSDLLVHPQVSNMQNTPKNKWLIDTHWWSPFYSFSLLLMGTITFSSHYKEYGIFITWFEVWTVSCNYT